MPTVAYGNSTVIQVATIESGQTTSNTIDCLVTPIGECTPRALLISPEGITQADLTFTRIENLEFTGITNFRVYISDSINTTIYTVSMNGVSQCINLVPYAFDSVSQFQIVSSIAQENTISIGVVLKPIYQKVA